MKKQRRRLLRAGFVMFLLTGVILCGCILLISGASVETEVPVTEAEQSECSVRLIQPMGLGITVRNMVDTVAVMLVCAGLLILIRALVDRGR